MKASEHAVEEQLQAHTEAEAGISAANVVDATEQVAKSKKAQSETEVVAQPKPVVEEAPEPATIERGKLSLPENINAEAVSSEEWQVEAKTVEIVEAAEEEAAREGITNEEPEAQALATEVAEKAAMMVSLAEEGQPMREIAQEQEKLAKEGLFVRLKHNLLKAKENLGSGSISLFRDKKIDDDLFEELEERLSIADMGVEATRKIITNLAEGASRRQLHDAEALYGLLKEEMGEIPMKVDEPLNVEGKTLLVILMVGTNDVDKTTTIGKLAYQFEQQDKSMVLAVGGTFRAAAVKQFQVQGQRSNIPVIAQHIGADSVSIIFDAIQAAGTRNIDALIADTAGHLQNRPYLMGELKKIVRVMKKLDVGTPHEVMPTIDASTGQSAVGQAKLFYEAVGLTDITLTKLDGMTRGGATFLAADQFGAPIRYVDVGECTKDLRLFKADGSIEAPLVRED